MTLTPEHENDTREQDRCPLCGYLDNDATLGWHLNEAHDINELVAEIRTLRTVNEALNAGVLAFRTKCEELEADLDRVRAERDAPDARYEMAVNDREAAYAKIAELTKERDVAKGALDAMTYTARQTQQDLNKARADRPPLGASISRHADKLILEARAERDEWAAKAERFKTSWVDQANEVDHLRAQLAEAREEIREYMANSTQCPGCEHRQGLHSSAGDPDRTEGDPICWGGGDHYDCPCTRHAPAATDAGKEG
jgi:chromosome segregation ATPase